MARADAAPGEAGAAVTREKRIEESGREPVPLWILLACGVVLLIGGGVMGAGGRLFDYSPHYEGYVRADFEAGGRPYKDVYGKLHTHYLTGSTTCTSDLDLWVRRGNTFDAFTDGDEVVFVLRGFEHNETPEGYQKRALAGEVLTWEHRGYVYRISPSRFPGNREPCTSISILSKPEGERSGGGPWMWRITKTGRAKTLVEAIRLAFEAEPVEVEE